MDEALALLVLAPVLAAGLGLAAFAGDHTLAQGRASVAATSAATAALAAVPRCGNSSCDLAAVGDAAVAQATQLAEPAALAALVGVCRLAEDAVSVDVVARRGWSFDSGHDWVAGVVVTLECSVTTAEGWRGAVTARGFAQR